MFTKKARKTTCHFNDTYKAGLFCYSIFTTILRQRKKASRQQYQHHLAGLVPPNMPEKIRIDRIITGTPKNSSL